MAPKNIPFSFKNKEFLNQYGYISHTRSGNHDVPTAIRNFQEYFGLPASGKLDDSTIRLMKKPRCGMPDPTGESRKRRYVTRSKWYKTELTYYVQPGLDLPAVSNIYLGRGYIYHQIIEITKQNNATRILSEI